MADLAVPLADVGGSASGLLVVAGPDVADRQAERQRRCHNLLSTPQTLGRLAVPDGDQHVGVFGDEVPGLVVGLVTGRRGGELDNLQGTVRQPVPELAAQLYAASLLAIEVDTPEEKKYLEELAAALGLEPEVTAHIHQQLGV